MFENIGWIMVSFDTTVRQNDRIVSVTKMSQQKDWNASANKKAVSR